MVLLMFTDHDVRTVGNPNGSADRLRLSTIPAIARTSRRAWLHLAERSTWAELLAAAIHRLRALAVPG